VCVFEHQEGEWKKARSREIRSLSTVIMDEQEKNDLLEDMKDFLDESSRNWYTSFGIPYRRGYLLYGPPGTGKSSFSLSIAGRFKLDIYVLNLSGVNDSSLNKLFAELPPHCVILLEDVDAVGLTRTDNAKAAQKKDNSKSKVSLSSLLNALDGVSSQEGRMLIMTTNHIEHLDEALIRPGRVDRKVYFKLADKDMSSQLFRSIFKASAERRKAPANQTDGETTNRLADEFAAEIPEQVFSPAEVLSFLVDHKRSPTKAVAGAREWVAKAKNAKSQLKRENSWVQDV
jgi:chaperone BCS1